MKSVKRTIEAGGGIYIGLQDDLVLFTTPNGNTVALLRDEVTEARVRTKISESNARFGLKEEGV